MGISQTADSAQHCPPAALPSLPRDISRGFEQVAIPCLNMVDQESYPRDFLYITGNIMSGSMLLPTKAWAQSQVRDFPSLLPLGWEEQACLLSI